MRFELAITLCVQSGVNCERRSMPETSTTSAPKIAQPPPSKRRERKSPPWGFGQYAPLFSYAWWNDLIALQVAPLDEDRHLSRGRPFFAQANVLERRVAPALGLIVEVTGKSRGAGGRSRRRPPSRRGLAGLTGEGMFRLRTELDVDVTDRCPSSTRPIAFRADPLIRPDGRAG